MPQKRRKDEWQLVRHKAHKTQLVQHKGTWNGKRKGCADALEKQRTGEWQNMQLMAYEMHRAPVKRWEHKDASGNRK